MSTLVYAVVDISDGRVRLACAGYPPPVPIEPNGTPELIWEGRSPLIGVSATDRPRHAAELTPDRGARLLFDIDGLVERRSTPLDDGLQRLLSMIQRHQSDSAEALVEALVTELLGDELARDEACLLCLDRVCET